MKKKNKGLFAILALVAVIGLIAITLGVTYSFFTYMKKGTTENTIRSGSIKFIYDETSKMGRGITLTDALPVITPEELQAAKTDKTQGKMFEFKIESETSSTIEIPYYITARMKADSTLDPNLVKVYLTQVDGSDNETEVLAPTKYGTMNQYGPIPSERYTEKLLYNDIVPINSVGANSYSQTYRLRMWLDSDADFSEVPAKCEFNDGTTTTDVTSEKGTATLCTGQGYTWTDAHYPLNGKTFTLTVNVYSTGNVNTSGTAFNASQIQYTPSYSGTTCTGVNANVECALDELNTLLG